MSNATQDSRNQGERRRRRSRGGQNRNQNQHRQGQHRDEQSPRGQNPNRRQGESRQRGFQDNRPARKYSQPKLTWWQKLLKLVGLYKEPARPARQERKPEAEAPASEAQAKVKSNTRIARSAEGDAPSPKKRERGESGRERGESGKRRTRGGDPSTVESARVYVGNLSYDVAENDLQDLFKGVGGVRNVEIVYNRSTHRSKGYGFVEMLHEDEAKRAVEVLHDQFFMGRKMTVSGAKSKGLDEREDQEDREPRRRPASEAAAVAAAPVIDRVQEITTIIEDVPASPEETAAAPVTAAVEEHPESAADSKEQPA